MEDFFLDPFKEKLTEYLNDQVRWQTGMKEELRKLEELSPQIKAVVFAAGQQEIGDQNPAFKEWLWQLRDAIEEADDVLDEFVYLKYKKQLAINKEKTNELHCTSFLIEAARKLFECACKVIKRAFKSDHTLKRLEEALHKLVNVLAKVSDFLRVYKIEEKGEQQQQIELYKTRETGASVTNNFIGRRKEMEDIMQWLRNSSNEDQSHITSSNLYNNISLLSIVGHGGMGKTTLSQHAYNNVMENEFDVKMWVCVSTNFDVNKVIAGMLESHMESGYNLGSLEGLQNRLRSEVKAKKFLLVLDDIWEDEGKDKWEKVFAPLAVGSSGSKILVTTRMGSVALMIAKVLSNKDPKTLRLEGLEDDDCLELLKSQAFATVDNPDAHKKSILKQIVKKVLGSPLAAKVIGGVLSDNMNETYWKKILDSDIRNIEESQNNLFPILKLSYMFLRKPLQSCFSFCSIFPQDHEFDKDDLIRMWIALNFIQPSSFNPKENLEDIGERYFDILIKKSFFDKFQYSNGTYYYKMHDLLHELAQFVSARECCRVVGDEELSNCETIRHLSVKTDDIEVLRKIKKLKKLRSLFLFSGIYNHKDFADVLSEIFKATSGIRLLFIDVPCQMPEAIGDLIHLRYLKCVNGMITTLLPISICTLYHMNFIIYTSWRESVPWYDVPCDFLPRDMNNLFNLRYAELPWNDLRKMHWIGELRPLQRLNRFFVKNEAGYRINELEHMNELCELRIYQLENVKDAEEARSAKFCDKGSLTKLFLYWGDDRNNVHSNLDEEVFDNLQPHNNLKRLKINAYMGTRSAKWMNEVISNLEYIKLEGCLEWVILPPFGQLRLLKSLYLHKMPKARNIDFGFHRNDEDCAFPSLEVLHIKDLDALEDWFDAAAANDSLFPCLTELCLERCPNLRVLPSLPTKLQSLKMFNIRWKCFSSLQDTSNCYEVNISDCGDLPGNFSYYMWTTESGQFRRSELRICDPSELLEEPLRRITSVIDLTICENDKLVSFPIETEEWFLQVSSSLRKLKFENLESLPSLPSFLKKLSSLEYLRLSNIPLLKSLSDLFSSLEELQLSELKSLQHLSSLSNISSLKRLSLEKIPLLKSLLDLPPSIEELSIKNLKSLECLPSSLSTFSSLKNLELLFIPLLKSLPVLPLSLEKLSIDELESLECLTSSLSTTSLSYLQIWNVPLLQQLPELPSSLKELWISGCHEELKKRYDKITGFDRDKVARLSWVFIR